MCQGQWGSWSECDAPCGSSTRQRTYIVEQQAANGGLPCTSDGIVVNAGDTMYEVCSLPACVESMHIDGSSCSIPYDLDGSGYVNINDLITLLTYPTTTVGDILGLLSYFGTYCYSKAEEYAAGGR